MTYKLKVVTSQGKDIELSFESLEEAEKWFEYYETNPGVASVERLHLLPYPVEPTGEECNTHARSTWKSKYGMRNTLACWYPQMGGYCGKCVIAWEDAGGCFEAYVWHDGDFPFSASGQSPARIHHCSPSQFIEFGESVEKAMKNDFGV